jgi:hypothetical protein
MSTGKQDLSFTYFPDNYRWSHGLLIGLNMAPWGGAEIGEINRIGLRLQDHVGNDDAWFREWAISNFFKSGTYTKSIFIEANTLIIIKCDVLTEIYNFKSTINGFNKLF